MSHVYICMCTANAAVGAGVARMREQTGVCTYMIQYRQSRRCMCILYRTAHHTSSIHRSSAQQCMHPCACTEETRAAPAHRTHAYQRPRRACMRAASLPRASGSGCCDPLAFKDASSLDMPRGFFAGGSITGGSFALSASSTRAMSQAADVPAPTDLRQWPVAKWPVTSRQRRRHPAPPRIQHRGLPATASSAHVCAPGP
jgi:hypothetical protein